MSTWNKIHDISLNQLIEIQLPLVTPFRALPLLSHPNALPEPTGFAFVDPDFISPEFWLVFRLISLERDSTFSPPFIAGDELDAVLETLDIDFPLGRRTFMVLEEVPLPARA